VQLAHDSYGDDASSPIVLLHGLSGSRLGWGPVVPHLVGRGDARVVNADLRGHGESGRATLETYDAGSYAADVAGLIESLGDQRAIVVGHSLGGVVAAALASARPDLVRGLFLEDPPLFEGDAERRAASPVASIFPALVAAVRERQVRGAPIEDYAALLEPGMPRDEAEARCRSLQIWDPLTMEAALAGVVWCDFDPLTPIECPITIVRADPDVGAVFRPDDEQRLVAALPHAVVVEVPGAGHTIHSAATLATFLGHLDAFLDAL
jgi:pimeloyl-ACP methyl ester carboxylesterase